MEGNRLKIGFFALLLLVTCCTNPPTVEHFQETTQQHQRLAAIDSLMQSYPDSALVCLLDSTVDDPYYQLLLSEVLYKNDYAQTNRQELLAAMNYFDSIHDPFLSARCHYMNGVGYYEMDSVVPACTEYLKALEIMEENFSEKDLVGHKAKFMALTYTLLCNLYSNQYLHDQAIYWGRWAIHYYMRFEATPWHLSWILETLGAHYDMKRQLDSADYYYMEAMTILPDSNSLIYRDLVSHRAFLLYETTQSPEIPLTKLRDLLNRSESETEKLARCLPIGGIYYYQNQFDSAFHYLTILR